MAGDFTIGVKVPQPSSDYPLTDAVPNVSEAALWKSRFAASMKSPDDYELLSVIQPLWFVSC